MSARSGSIEFSIRGDELEQNRIQLEQNLQHTDISLHLSSPNDSDVEYPRHNSGPEQFAGFASFDHISRDNFDPDESHYNAWSYRTADDDNGINPYEGRTISTAAHHASALTLSAGLAGRGSRRDVSMSGAEYDPDRPLTGIIPGFGTRIPGIDGDSTRSRHFASATVDFDPLVVDDSAELDQVLQTGHAPIPASGLRSPSSASSSSRPNTPMSPRPKLSDALNHVSFSPKRPRRPQSPLIQLAPTTKPRAVSSRLKSSARSHPIATVDSDEEDKVPTPRSRNKRDISYSYTQQSLSYAQPEVNVLPPTPPSPEHSSKFTKMARGLAQEIEYEQSREGARRDLPVVAQSTVRERKQPKTAKVPLRSVVSELQDHNRNVGSRTPYKNGKIYLPDMTGLTSAIASPMKLGVEYKTYVGRDDREIDVRLATTLNVVQSKLAQLEAENSISRRRVRELELELEECKRDVARERTKILEREQFDAHSAQEKASRATHKGVRVVEETEDDIRRYKEAVEEKKALEALISTLRSHLSRLTIELSDHSRLLQELRELRDSDVLALKDKSHEINRLRQEVERLAGEVEVLRGVVEEGLKERREVREQSVEQSRSFDRPRSPSVHEADISNELPQIPEQRQQQQQNIAEQNSDSDAESADSHSTPSPKPTPQRRQTSRPDDRTVRTDLATIGSPSTAPRRRLFIDPTEITRISEDISERRLERSGSVSAITGLEHSQVLSHQGKGRGYHTDSDGSEDEGNYSLRDARPRSRVSDAPNTSTAHETRRVPSPIRRPAAPVPSSSYSAFRANVPRPKSPERHSRHAAGPSKPAATGAADAPFPQIRGEYLERLFFSAPDHNADTCTVCNRRTRARQGQRKASWGADKWGKRGASAKAEDEGFVEGSPKHRAKGKERECRPSDEDRLPPQTVLARVLRELEDDFTHYKGIYVELADQYKDIDPVSNVAKRNVLAEHLRDVIDILEQKGDQIASLYDLLAFNDKPVEEAVPNAPTTTSSWVRSQGLRKHPTCH